MFIREIPLRGTTHAGPEAGAAETAAEDAGVELLDSVSQAGQDCHDGAEVTGPRSADEERDAREGARQPVGVR